MRILAATVAAVGLACAGCGGAEQATEPAAEPETRATQTAPPAPTTAAAPEAPVRSTAGLDGDLRPGEYQTAGFMPPFSFEVRPKREGEAGWRGDVPSAEIAETARKYGLDPAGWTGETRWAIVAEEAFLPYFEFIRLIDPEREATRWGITFVQKTFYDPVREVVKELRGMDGLKAGKPAPASIGEFSGRRFDAVVTADPLYPTLLYSGSGTDMFFARGQNVRFIVLDGGTETEVVAVEAPAEEFDQFLPEAEEFLATVRWGSPTE